MKILMVAPQPFFTERGTPINIRLMCQVLGRAGHQIDLLTFPTGKDVPLDNVNVIRIPNVLSTKKIPIGPSFVKLVFDVVLFFYATFLCIAHRYDVIHGIEEGGFIAVFLGNIGRIYSIYDMDSSIAEQLQYSRFIRSPAILKAARMLETSALRNASLIITVCSALTETARSITTTHIVQIEDIPLQGLKRADKNDVQEFIITFGLNYKKRVIYTGNLEAYQGIDLLLDSWAYLTQHCNIHRTATLVMVGGDQKGIKKYADMAAEKKIAGSIAWIGHRPSREMAIWMAMADVLVSPRRKGENTPLKLYSYMASLRPIVATDIKSHSQVLDDSVAFLAKPDPRSLGQAIHQSLTDPALSTTKSQNAMTLSKRKYSYPMFRKKLLSSYEELNTLKS